MKFDELIVGDFYRYGSIYFRFSGIKDNYVCTTGYFIFNYVLHVDKKFKLYSITDRDIYNSVEINKILDMLPENHPDKIVLLRKQRLNKLLSI